MSNIPSDNTDVMHDADLARVRRILNGDTQTWHALLLEVGDDILTTALTWCPPCARSCRFRNSHFGDLLQLLLKQDCDEVSEGFLFICETILTKSLPAYRGGNRLLSFLWPLFHDKEPDGAQPGRYGYRQLTADFWRHKQGRRRVPKAVEDLGFPAPDVFKQMCAGGNAEAIAQRLGLKPEDAREWMETVALAAGVKQGKRVAWKRGEYVPTLTCIRPLDDPDWLEKLMEDDTAGPHEQTLVREAMRIMAASYADLSADDKVLLRLRYGSGLTAEQVAVALDCHAKHVPGRARRALERLRKSMCAATAEMSPPDLGAIRDALRSYFVLDS